MRKYLIGILTVLVAISFVAGAFAAEKKAAKAMMMTHIGIVTAVDAAANTVTIKSGKKEYVVNITPETPIMMGKAKKTIEDVKVGDKVRCKHEMKDGKNICKGLTILKAAVKGEKKEGAKKPAKPAPGY